MTNCRSASHGTAMILTILVTKLARAITPPPPAGDNVPQLNSRGSIWEAAISTGTRARMVTMGMMRMRIMRKMYPKMMMH